MLNRKLYYFKMETNGYLGSLVIGGDLCPVGSAGNLLAKGRYEHVFGDLKSVFSSADYAIANLECPFVDGGDSIGKSGPTLKAGTDILAGICSTGFDCLSLANNHILDYGAEGLLSTLNACKEAGVDVVGADINLEEARKWRFIEVGGSRIAIVAMAEQEFSIAGKDTPGAAPLDIIEFMRSLWRQSEMYDFIIVLLHAGYEHFPYPTPELQKICRFLAECGVDAILCSHSHVPAAHEWHKGAFISYGLGNLLFDWGHLTPEWNKGYLVRISVNHEPKLKVEIIPYQFDKDETQLRLLTGTALTEFMDMLLNRSAEIKNSMILRNLWREFCIGRAPFIYNNLLGYSRPFRLLNHLTRFAARFRKASQKRNILNTIRCESHRESVISLLESELEEVDF